MRGMAFLLYVLGLGIPLYMIRGYLGVIPVSIVDFLIGGLVIWGGQILWSEYRLNSEVGRLRRHLLGKIEFWLFFTVGIFGLLPAQDLVSSLGIFKSVILMPIILYGIVYVFYSLKKWLIRGMISSGVWLSVLVISQTIIEESRPFGVYQWVMEEDLLSGGVSNYMAMYLVPVLILSFLPDVDWPRWLRRSVQGIMVGGILALQSYAAIGSLLVVTMIAGVRSLSQSRDALLKQGGVIIGGSLLVLFLLGFWAADESRFTSLDMRESNSLTSRIQIWHLGWIIGNIYPWQGIGFADFESEYTTRIGALYDYPGEWLVPHPHNLYLAFWIYGGVAGIAFVLVLLWRIGGGLCRQGSPYVASLALFAWALYGLFDTPFWKYDLALIGSITIFFLIYGSSIEGTEQQCSQ